ncbi:MAG: DUF3192 domain-containing protein [Candidatus Omnitrophica bacterium]|nr:DUF3192 domain-containing protein [Candidatus Omnitrophota bacterium]MBU1996405.1 DUF3192 domain-containing protein [Candidatus Omnitrophota bacterium]MBU4333684.1 DUF3192 domain-containing protein [Candidatus Omnitrophota bacterium]
MKKFILILSLLLCGCATTNKVIDNVVIEYQGIQDNIKIGDSKEKFLSLLEPNQSKLNAASRKPPTRYTENGSVFDVYYIRTGRIPDGATTDDEFTPYIFKDGALAEIGWEHLGGAKRTSVDVAKEYAEIRKAEAGATKVETNWAINNE